MLRSSTAAIAAWLFLAPCFAQAGFVVQGFSYTRLAPPLPGGDYGVLSQAVNPVTGAVWTSDGQTLHRLGTAGDWDHSESIVQKDGGPVRNFNVTSSIVFDSQGRLYINDFGTGGIYRRDDDSAPWELWIQSYRLPQVMHFDAAGNLVLLGNNSGSGTPGDVGRAWSITPDGTVIELGATQGEAFTFGPDGSLIIPVWAGGGIHRLNADGSLEHLFEYDDFDGEWESIARTAQGNYVVGINMGFDWELDRNTSKIIRVNGVTGERELLAIDLDLSIPVEMWFADGDLAILGSGSIRTGTVVGDFDGPLVPLVSTPEPGAMTLAATAGLGLLLTVWRRRRVTRCRRRFELEIPGERGRVLSRNGKPSSRPMVQQ